VQLVTAWAGRQECWGNARPTLSYWHTDSCGILDKTMDYAHPTPHCKPHTTLMHISNITVDWAHSGNMTGHHRGPKWKLLVTERCHDICVLCAISHIYAYWTSFTVTHVIFFFVKCGIAYCLCTMHVFNVRASSSPLRLPLCQIPFLLHPPVLS